jgi:hypothetical protein
MTTKRERYDELCRLDEDTDKMPAIPPAKLNTKREALAMAARYLREHQREVWAQYKWSPQVQEVCDGYREVIHRIELQIVELDRQEQERQGT